MSGDFDRIIDDVAHEMTSAPVGPGFVERVQRRVAAAEAARRSRWTRPALLAPVAAACILIVSVFVMRDRTPHVEPLRAPAMNVASAPAVVRPNDEQAATVTRVQKAVPVRAAAAPRVAPSPLPAIEIPALEVERLDVAPMAQAQQLEIDIDPIAIARIEIAPMP